MTQPSILELARQGDVKAIATLLNRSMQTQGITAKATVKNGCLHILAESVNAQNQEDVVSLVRNSLIDLGAVSINKVKIYGKQIDKNKPDWNQEIELIEQQLSSSIPNFTGRTEHINKLNEDESITEREELKSVDSRTDQVPNTDQSHHVSQSDSPRSYYQNRTRFSVSNPEITIQSILKSALEGFKISLINPVGGLPSFFASLEKPNALRVGVVFSVIYIISVLVAGKNMLENFQGLLSGSKIYDGLIFNLFLIGIVQTLSLFVACIITRKLFRANGSLEGDVFITGASLLPSAIFLFLSSFLGIGNIEIIIILLILSGIYTVLVFYTGCTRISELSEKASPLAISAILIVSIWLNKIIITSIFW